MRRSAGRPQSEIRTSEDLTTAPAWDILYGDGAVIGAAQNGIHARGTRNAHAAKPRTKHREPSPVLRIGGAALSIFGSAKADQLIDSIEEKTGFFSSVDNAINDFFTSGW